MRREQVDPEMTEEAPVLGGDHRIDEALRDVIERDEVPGEVAVRRDRRAVGREHADSRVVCRPGQGIGLGQVVGEVGQEAESDDARPDEENEQPFEQEAAQTRAPLGLSLRTRFCPGVPGPREFRHQLKKRLKRPPRRRD